MYCRIDGAIVFLCFEFATANHRQDMTSAILERNKRAFDRRFLDAVFPVIVRAIYEASDILIVKHEREGIKNRIYLFVKKGIRISFELNSGEVDLFHIE